MADTIRIQTIAAVIRALDKWLMFAGISAMLLPGLAFAQIPDLKVTQYQLVSSKRINATQFEYEYRVSVTNSGGTTQQVTASVSPSSANTQVIDGGVSFGTVQAGQTIASSDTIKLRQDRRFALGENDFHWHFEYVTAPVRLDGTPTAPVTVSTRDFYNGDVVSDSEISDHPLYGPVARTKLIVVFQESASTQQVNDVLDFLHGGITSMLLGSPTFGLRIPDPNSIVALDSLIANVKLNPGVKEVFPGITYTAQLLPSDVSSDDLNINMISHHLAAKGHGLWNARKGFNDRFLAKPTLGIVDFFGGDPPTGPAWEFIVPVRSDFKWSLLPNMHGYFVASIIGASFGGGSPYSLSDQVTGLLPGPVNLVALDMKLPIGARISGWDVIARVIIRLRASGSNKHVVNISFSNCGSFICNNTAFDFVTEVVGHGVVNAVRTAAGMENSVLFTVAAGNYKDIPAARAGFIQRAFTGPFSNPAVTRLTNGLVVESFLNYGATEPANAIGCRADNISTGGTIGAFGQSVSGYEDAAGKPTVSSGSSAAAPQVAAIAHFVWTMADPAITAPQIVDRIIASGYPKTGCGDGDGLVVDAYAAALTADTEIKIGRAPVRETILDVANDQDQDIPDGKFDHHDVRRFLKAFSDSATAAAGNGGNYVADYSRYDLNGDGYTEGITPTHTSRFKLEEPFPSSYTRPTPLSYGTVTQNIEGVPVTFNEKNLTDLEILAYYAYSPLFVSTPESQFERAMLFLPHAAKLHIELNRIAITWKPLFQTPSGWTTPPVIELYGLGPPSPTYSSSLGEKGIPLYSLDVPANSTFFDVYDTNGAPYRLYPNRLPSSSFFAYDALGRAWINATTGHWEISSTGTLEREYQSRFYLGAPTASGRSKTVTIGSVPGDNNFNAATKLTGEYFDVSLKFIAAP